MSAKSVIAAYVAIRDNRIIVNDNSVFEWKEESSDFLNAAYHQLGINYPKFFKMDNLCKTGFIAVEFLLGKQKLSEKYKPEETGIIFSTTNGCLDTDIRFQTSTEQMPSPALFVYTLPNILIGELCIRHGIKGESACLIFDIFDVAAQTDYLDTVLKQGYTKACISGWADFYNEKAEAFFYLVEKGESILMEHNSENVSKIYSGIWSN